MEYIETPAPIPKPTLNRDIKFIFEYKFGEYIIKIGKISSDIEELTIFVKNDNKIEREYYQRNFSLEKLQKTNKILRQFDTIDEILDALKDIISEKRITLTKENDTLLITFEIQKIGKGQEKFNLILGKNNLEVGKMIDILISNINNLKLEVNKLTEKNGIKKYSPTLENGWKLDPYVPSEFIVFKNNNGKVKIQGSVLGDWSKKIFTLEKDFRTKNMLCFPVMANEAFNRLNILPNGDVCLAQGISIGVKGFGWVSFDGISYYITE